MDSGGAGRNGCIQVSRVQDEKAGLKAGRLGNVLRHHAGTRLVSVQVPATVRPNNNMNMNTTPILPLSATLAIFVGVGLATTHPARGADNEAPAGFISLFNGKDFTGWKVPAGDNGHWKVVDGAIDYDAQSEAKGDKSLHSEREFTDYILHVDWRIKETPYVNPNVPYILPDGTHARDIRGKEMRMALPDSDSGVFVRGSGRHQVNIWCWPIGSGEMYGIRTDSRQPAELRAAVTPRHQADKPVGEWNHYEITVRGKTVTVVLNGKTVIPTVTIPDLPARGGVGLQHHGGKDRSGNWNSPPSLLQFKNIFVKELSP